MTNWDAVGAIGELIGGGAVLITLIYLVIQVRQQSRSINSMTTQTSFTQFNEISMQMALHPELAKAFEQGLANPESLSDEDATRFTWIMRQVMNNYLNLYDQFVEGACTERLWLRVAKELKSFYDQSPGLQQFRKSDPGFEDVFEYMDKMPADEHGNMRGFHDFRNVDNTNQT